MEKYRHKVMYYETDKMGITHHSNYIRFMEEARVDFLEKIGFPYEKLEQLGAVSPVTSVECRFRTPTTFSDVIEISVSIEQFNGARFRVGYIMTNAAGDVVCEAHSEHCFVNSSGRPIRLSKISPEFDKKMNELVQG